MATVESTTSANRGASIDLVLETLRDEHDKQLALATQLTRELAPPDEGDVDDKMPTTEYRLAQLLEERLSKTWLEEFVSTVMRDAYQPTSDAPKDAAPSQARQVTNCHLSPACTGAKDLAHYSRQAMSYLLMATMEMHTRSGTTEQAYDLANKALDAIGALRVMTNVGRIQS
ncbi:MAG: hypothetical protein KDH93_21270 [Rhodoferax sp.]|nr:hypothetical protein [Rhodoferax sp.]MCP5263660.1 hypothetical protein [Rhodoferax sp.]